MCTYTFYGNYYIGTYGGGMYVLDPLTMKLRDFDIHEPFPFIKGSIFGINADYEDIRNRQLGACCIGRDSRREKYYC